MPVVVDTRRASLALVLMALLGIALVFLFPGSPEQDTYYHFLQAKAAWANPDYFIGVWSRPLFTAVFALPDRVGFMAGRFFAVALGVATAWQAWRLALDLKLERAWLVIPFLLAQPVFFELYPDMLTEPLFGFVFVIAVRWHLRGWVKRAMVLASFLPLARPEGFFLGVLWGVWALAGAAAGGELRRPAVGKILRAIPSTLLLATGTAVWWFAALCISHDPLFIPHHWPSQWHQGMYGQGNILSYAGRSVEFLGALLVVPFLAGLWKTVRLRTWMPLTSSFLLLFVLHSIFRVHGLFGEAGYPRYMVSVAPATAVITLQGWNMLAARLARWPRLRAAVAWGIVAFSLAQSFVYLDYLSWSRNAVAIDEMSRWLRATPVPHARLIWSDARMCIDLGETVDTSPPISSQNDTTANFLRNAPPGTLVFWDSHLGPDWFGLGIPDVEKCGYKILRDQSYSLRGVTGVAPFDTEVALLVKQ